MSEIENNDVDIKNNEQDLELEEDLEEGEKPEDKPEGKKEETPEKPKETPEDRVARLKRQYERELKKLGKTEDKSESKEKATKSSEIDYGQLAFYNTKSDAVKIESDEDIEFLKETMEDTGKSQQAILGSKWFLAELKERAESRKSSDAVPKGSKRSSSSSKDSVDYWLAKGELPPNEPEYVELRRKVVNARYERESKSNKFGNPTGGIVRQSQLRK